MQSDSFWHFGVGVSECHISLLAHIWWQIELLTELCKREESQCHFYAKFYHKYWRSQFFQVFFSKYWRESISIPRENVSHKYWTSWVISFLLCWNWIFPEGTFNRREECINRILQWLIITFLFYQSENGIYHCANFRLTCTLLRMRKCLQRAG